MDSLKLTLTKIADRFLKSASLYVAVIVIFSYHVLFEKDLACTCKGQTTDCWLYMTLPALLIMFLLLWIDKTFQRLWRYTLSVCQFPRFWFLLLYRILAAILIGLLWSVSVLIDGEWYVCCYPDDEYSQLACKAKENLTDEDQIIIAGFRNKSRVSVYFLYLDSYKNEF